MVSQSSDVCYNCGKGESKFLYSTASTVKESFHLHECQFCEAIYLNPHPTAAQLDKAYDESYYGTGEEKFNSFVEKVLNYFRKGRAKKISGFLKPKSKVLDVGCGNGKFLGFVSEFDHEIYGIETSGKSADRAARVPLLNLKTGTLSSDTYPENSFDAITLFHVYEHLHNPNETLEIISEILKPNGVLAISVPNINSWQSSLYKGDWLALDPPRHLFFFRPKRFIELLDEKGFELISEKYFNVEQSPFGHQQSILNKFLKKRDVLYESIKNNEDYYKEYSSFSIKAQQMFYKLSFPLFIVVDAIDSLFGKGGNVDFVFRKK